MSHSIRKAAEALFKRAAPLPPADRADLLDDACDGDLELRAEVESLLAELDAGTASFLRAPGLADPPESTGEFAPGQIVGGEFKLLEVLGEGGLGVVWLAEQAPPVRRKVALKVVKRGMDSKQVLARFEGERNALTLMDHPNIARVLDAGVTETGQPFFVMEHVAGVSINRFCDHERLTTAERLRVFVDVCRAVQHAHQKGIIHRDLKPSNILVTLHEGKPVPKVIDFGIAKATAGHLSESTLFTEQGQLLGTPEYMSPEQAEMSGVGVDSTTDIYSLGVLLYELLTSVLPFDPKTLRSRGLAEISRVIREVDAERPSSRITTLGEKTTTIAEAHGTDPRTLRSQLRGDLDWIVMKALEKQRTRRYPSASELAADVERHLNDEPVLAAAPSLTYRLAKSFRRHRTGFLAAAAVLLALAAGLVALAVYSLRLDRELRVTRHLARSYESTDSNPKEGLAAARAAVSLDARPETVSQLQAALAKQFEVGELVGHTRRVDMLHYSKEHGLVVSAALDGARVWDLRGNAPSVALPHPGSVRSAAFAPDGSDRILTCDRTGARVWNTRGALVWSALEGDRATTCALWNPDGTEVATGHVDGTVRLWHARTGQQKASDNGHAGVRVAGALYCPDGRLVTYDDNGTILIRDLSKKASSKRAPLTVHSGQRVNAAVVDAAGTKLATGGWHGSLKLWDLRDGRLTAFDGHPARIAMIRFSADGHRLLTAAADRTARLWNSDGTFVRVVARHGLDVLGAVFVDNETKVLTWSGDTTAALWSVSGRSICSMRGHAAGVRAGTIVAGDRILTGAIDGSIKCWSIRGRHGTFVAGAQLPAPGPRGELVVWTPGAIHILDRERLLRHVIDTPRVIRSMSLSPDGHLVAGAKDGTLSQWRKVDGRYRLIRTIEAHSHEIWTARYSPDGTAVLTCCYDGAAYVWDADLAAKRELWREGGNLKYAAWSPDGNWIALPGTKGVRLCSRTGEERWTKRLHGAMRIRSAEFDPTSRLIVTGADDGTAVVWNLDGERITTLAGHHATVTSAAFSPNGKSILTASRDGTARMWKPDGTYLFSLPEDGPLTRVLFSQDGRWAITAVGVSHVRFWPVEVGDLMRLSK